MTDIPKIKLGQVFHRMDLLKARRIMEETRDNKARVKRLEEEVVKPRLDHINFVTGQDNFAQYWAYVLLHAFTSLPN